MQAGVTGHQQTMCGRFTLTQSGETLAEVFQLDAALDIAPRYNIAPTQPVAVVLCPEQTPHRHLSHMRWGLIPSWAKDPTIGNRLINARAETVGQKPSFRTAFKRRRCLIPADGFYEWQRQGNRKAKQPFYIFLKEHQPFAFAGLWEQWTDPNSGGEVETCTLLTTEPNRLMASMHNRMPVILAPEHYDRWLESGYFHAPILQGMLTPLPEQQMDFYPVSTLVNSPAHETPDCLAPLPQTD